MSDDTKQALDNFGVWVKTPPQTVDSEAAGAKDTAQGFPDHASLDTSTAQDGAVDTEDFGNGDTTLSLSELSAIAESHMITEDGNTDNGDGTEEVSLDEFIDGGVFEGDAAVANDLPQQTFAAESGEHTSHSDSSSSALPASDITAGEPVSSDDDGPLNIDLSFDDTPAESASVDNNDGMEHVDLSEFGLDESGNETPAPATTPVGDSEDVTAEFAELFEDMRKESENAEPEPTQTADANSMEEIDLREFGFDSGEETESAETVDEEEFSVSLGSGDEPLPTLTVTADDDERIPSAPSDETEAVETSTATEEAFSPPQTDHAENGTSTATTDILQQIMGELRSLKDEIAGLKNDVEQMRSRAAITESGVQEETVPTVDNVLAEADTSTADGEIPAFTEGEDESQDATNAADAGGFFGGDDVDETIALSLDELGNILNTADFTEEEASESAPADDEVSIFGDIDDNVPEQDYGQATSLQMDFSENELEEPEITAFENDVEDADTGEALPEEIPVPKVDDVIVESEQTDFIDNSDAADDALTEDKLSYLAEEPTDGEVMPPLPEETQELDTSVFDTDTAADDAPAAETETTDAASEQDEAEPSIEPVPVTEDIGTIEVELPEAEAFTTDAPITDTASTAELSTVTDNTAEPAEPPAVDATTTTAETETPTIDATDAVTIAESPIDVDAAAETPLADEDSAVTTEASTADATDAATTIAESPAVDIDATIAETPLTDEDTAETETPAIDATDAVTIAESPAIDVDAAAETPLADEDSAVSTEASTADATNAATIAESPAVDVDAPTTETPLTDEDTTETEAQVAAPIAATSLESTQEAEPAVDGIPGDLRQEIKSVLSYMDQLLENLPEEKIAEFAQSDQFTTYKKLFKELGLA